MPGRIAVLLLSVGAAWGGLAWYSHVPPPTRTGMVHATEVRVASELAGRIASVAVAPGDRVRRGATIATLDVPELAAQLGEASAAAAAAAADRSRVLSGTRQEEIGVAEEAVRTAEAQLTLASEVEARISTLAAQDVASEAQHDDSAAALAKAGAELARRRAELDAARAGPTAEERGLAETRVSLAEATVAELEARLAKARVLAPADGTIGVRVAEVGEIVGRGAPIATLVLDGGTWFGFTLREDRLSGLDTGREITLSADDGPITALVVELRGLGEFATWRASRAVGQHDVNSLRVRLDPLPGAASPEAGRTVWLPDESTTGNPAAKGAPTP